MSEIPYWLWLTLKKGIASRKITALLEQFETPENVFYAEKSAFSQVAGLTDKDVSSLCNKSLANAEKVIATCRQKGIKILTFDSPYYPRLLAGIYDPPYVLYAKYGERIDLNTHMTLAVVGTRSSSPYGEKMAEIMARSLAEEGVTVVSGMARGIDGAAAKGALRGGGKTIAVLGCGVDICYPAVHKALMEEIIKHGMVLSEYPPGTPPFSGHFKPRNRIITGLSLGTVIVEAPERSGAINSANWTAEHNREIFVVPGDATRQTAQGSNKLMIEGAKPVLCAEDVLCDFKEQYAAVLEQNRPNLSRQSQFSFDTMPAKERPAEHTNKQPEKATAKQAPPPLIPLSDKEKKVYMLLTEEPVHIDRLVDKGLSAAELHATLTMLELKGQIKALPGKYYCLKNG